MWKSSIGTGLGFSEKAVWSRASRRHQASVQSNKDATELAFGFKVQVEALTGGQAGAKVRIRWVKGHDTVIFESFCGMLKRKLEAS
jgi:23S rRNA (adenine1618-N6)-methyltransferase